MHAYLFVGQEVSALQFSISNLAKKLNTRVMEFPILKIDDVRNLNNLVRLSFDQPTLIVCNDIHQSGEEALNAFLKNLEEPQENVYFALTTTSVKKVLPTIVSRCQIIKVKSERQEMKEGGETEKFLDLSVGEKLSYIDKIKDRKLAIEFAENMVNFMHSSLHQKELKYSVTADNIRLSLKTLSGLKANGNVNLQLSNFVINYKYAK